MASTEEIVQRLRDSQPPATDAATYLTILEMSLSPQILPALHEMLQDATLTSEIGWDLVDMLVPLVPLPGSESCLETVARLGNPREVILKVLEALDKSHGEEGEDGDDLDLDLDLDLDANDTEDDDDAGEIQRDDDDENDDENDDDDDDGGKGRSSPTTEDEKKKKKKKKKNEDADADRSRRFVVLCGMLGILHKRLRVKAPSRFLHTTLDTVLRAYAHTAHRPASTAALIALVQALAGFTARPPLPARRASALLDVGVPRSQRDTGRGGADAAPDPEADDDAQVVPPPPPPPPTQQKQPLQPQLQPQDEQQHSESETRTVMRLMQAFIACAVEEYVRHNGLEWAARLLEFEYPERLVAGRPSVMRMFKERDDLHERDAQVGQLVSLASDLGLANLPRFKVQELLEAPICRNPLAEEDPDKIQPSTGGMLCLHAYWMFAAEVFDADRGLPERQLFPRYMLPEHHLMLQKYLGLDPQGQIARNPGTVEALIVMAIALDAKQRHVDGEENQNVDEKQEEGTDKEKEGGEGEEEEEEETKKKKGEKGKSSEKERVVAEFMPYHHLLTLVSVFHPNLRVRNAATVVAGNLLHADPDEDSRLAIMEDLLENCMFSGLQACAVTWLREEIILANTRRKKKEEEEEEPQGKQHMTRPVQSRFSTPECLDTIQYALFPDLTRLNDADAPAALDFWSSHGPLHLQVANFALFLFSGEDYKGLAPAGMAAAIEHRYVEPLVHAAGVLMKAMDGGEVVRDGELMMQLSILTDTLGLVPLQ